MEGDSLLNMSILLLGGLGLFLYGMSVMSVGLEKLAGEKLQWLIAKLSGRVTHGIAVGTIVTAIIQSSSATTVMVVGFVNAGVMNLTQAIGIIMGANIGTTITAQLIAINVYALAPLGIALGVGLRLFGKRNKTIVIGETIFGFALIFFGMKVMTSSIGPVRDIPAVTDFIAGIADGGFRNSLIGFLGGVFFTALLQSSSATTGIMVAMASTGLLPFEAAFPVLMGTNVGTCITALLSSIGANNTAKRAAMMHLLFNVVGTFIFLTLFSGISVEIIKSISQDPAKQLANAHTLFNIINTVILFPFAGLIVKASTYIIPVTEDEEEEKKYQRVMYLDERLLATPKIAMAQVYKEVNYMATVVRASFIASVECIVENDDNKMSFEKTFKLEKNINAMERLLVEYLIKLSNTSIGNDDRRRIDILFNTINDLERVGDHAENIAELAKQKYEETLVFSESAREELEKMIAVVVEGIDSAVESMVNHDTDLAKKAIELEGVVDDMERVLRKQHIARLNSGACEPNGGILFLDTLSNLERISDHASNISMTVLDA